MTYTPAELEAMVNDGWAFLAERGEGSDAPASVDELAAARYDIAWALYSLDRFQDSIAAADALATYGVAVAPEADEKWPALALTCKRAALAQLGRDWEAAATDAEIIIRFRESAEPDVREQVAVALSQRCAFLLTIPDRFGEGLGLSDELLELFTGEPDESVLALAEVMATHMQRLLARGSSSVRGHAAAAAEILWASCRTTSTTLWGRARTAIPGRLPELAELAILADRLSPAEFARSQARAREVLRIGPVTLERIAQLEDVGKLEARIALMTHFATMRLGHFGAATDAIMAMNQRRDPDVAAVFQDLVDEQASPATFLTQLGRASTLWLRADALIGDDPASARLAFEDSLAKALPASTSRLVRWLLSHVHPPWV